MRRPRHTPLFALTGLLLTLGAAPALADGTGGVAAPQPVPPAQAGGAAFSVVPPNARPVAHLTVGRTGTRPAIRARFSEPGVRWVTADVVVLRQPGNAVAARVALGRVAVGRTVTIPWPSGLSFAAGRYLVRVHAHDAAGHQLRRASRFPGRAFFHVAAASKPVVPAPPATSPAPAPTSSGVFPVVGSYSYGDPFGAPRSGYFHQGQDVLAAEGTPIVSPLSGTISTVGYQASAAGYYVVLNASDGHAYFFAHCQKDSTAVASGATVRAGAPICRMGHTGDATGPHLHFEEWVGGWRVNSASHPVDPLPQLKAWAQ